MATLLRNELLSRRERHALADAQLAKDELAEFKNWPVCAKCLRPVRAYGIGSQSEYHLTVWARCNHGTHLGIAGRDVFDEVTVKKPSRDVLQAAPAWLTNQLRLMVFFGR